MPDEGDIKFKPLPPEEAIAYFRSKGLRMGFAYQDVMHDEHAAAVTVAKMMRLDLLSATRNALDQAIAEGQTLEQFQAGLEPTLKEAGWWGRQPVTDPMTGETVVAQLGSDHRLRVIYDTNVRMAYAAGRWQQIERVAANRPWLRYTAILDSKTRPMHRAWHGTILRWDHPWWRTHFPPCGWFCRCCVQQLSDADLERYGFTPSDGPPDDGDYTWINKRTGEALTVPNGIDPGFGYNPGLARARMMTPPPLDAPLSGPYAGDPTSVPMPPARILPSSNVLPKGQPSEDYVSAFLEEFGTVIGKPTIFRDAAGEDLVISDQLFRRASDGGWKAGKHERGENILLLANAIKAPDEIWWVWQQTFSGDLVLRRRYLKKAIIDGNTQPLMTVFEAGKDGWTGVTAFDPDKVSYLERQRAGALIWRRAAAEDGGDGVLEDGGS